VVPRSRACERLDVLAMARNARRRGRGRGSASAATGRGAARHRLAGSVRTRRGGGARRLVGRPEGRAHLESQCPGSRRSARTGPGSRVGSQGRLHGRQPLPSCWSGRDVLASRVTHDRVVAGLRGLALGLVAAYLTGSCIAASRREGPVLRPGDGRFLLAAALPRAYPDSSLVSTIGFGLLVFGFIVFASSSAVRALWKASRGRSGGAVMQ